jgi:serine/threonine protein kinase
LIPGYSVVAHIRRGTRLDVYDVWSEDRSCRCVAKTLRPDQAGEPEARRGLLREAETLLGSTHPHLVRAYELVERPILVLMLETVSGPPLEQLIALEGRLGVYDAAFVGIHVSSALGYLHHRGILHRDVTPSNVICERGIGKLIDLSLACRIGHRSQGGSGTAPYMPPEQVRGGVLTEAIDVWALGAVLYEAVAGVPAFVCEADDRPQVSGRAESVRRHRRVPRILSGLIDASLDPDPAKRPTMASVRENLRTLITR